MFTQPGTQGFLGPVNPEEAVNMIMPQYNQQYMATCKEKFVTLVLDSASPSRLAAHGLDGPALITWTDSSFCPRNIAVEYRPSGSVLAPDILP